MSLLESVRKFLNRKWTDFSEDDKRVSTQLLCDSSELSHLLKEVLRLHEESNELEIEFTANLVLDQENIVTASLSQSLKVINVDNISQEARERIDDLIEYGSVNTLLSALDKGSTPNPKSWIELLNNESALLSKTGIKWKSKISMSKKPIEISVQERWESAGIKGNVIVFLSKEYLTDYLKSEDHIGLASYTSESAGATVFAVGGLDYIGLGRYSIICDLWMTVDEIRAGLGPSNHIESIQTKTKFLSKVMTNSIQKKIVPPELFEVPFESSRSDLGLLESTFESLRVLYTLLFLASNVVATDLWNNWQIQFVGQKTIEGFVSFRDGRVRVNGESKEEIAEPLLNLYHWTFDDMDNAKVQMTRKTIALHSSNLSGFLADIISVQKSAEAAFNLYVDQTVSAVLETRQKFIEFVQDWSRNDIESKLKMNEVIYNATYGGFGTILSIAVGLVAQPMSPEAASIILLGFPIVFVLYLLLAVIKIHQITQVFQSYLSQHLKCVEYYRTVLGEDTVEVITEATTKESLEREFISKKRNSCYIIAAMISISLIALLLIIYSLFN